MKMIPEIKMKTHKKGDPFPEHNFDGLEGYSSKSDQICYSNEMIKLSLNRIYYFSNATEAQYVYVELVEDK